MYRSTYLHVLHISNIRKMLIGPNKVIFNAPGIISLSAQIIWYPKNYYQNHFHKITMGSRYSIISDTETPLLRN